MWDFIVWVVCERECEDSSAYWRKCGFREYFARNLPTKWAMCKAHDWNAKSHDNWFFRYFVSKAFPQDTRETFCFVILAYLLHHVFTHTIYTPITHILREVLSEKKPLTQPLRVRDCHTHNPLHNHLWFSSTPISLYPNPWEVDSLNTYYTHSECKVRFWFCCEALKEAICLVDAIGLNCVIRRVREDTASSS